MATCASPWGFGLTKADTRPHVPHGDLAEILDRFGIERAHVVGCSQGGKIALDFALTQSARVRSLALISSGLGGYVYPGEPSSLVRRIAM